MTDAAAQTYTLEDGKSDSVVDPITKKYRFQILSNDEQNLLKKIKEKPAETTSQDKRNLTRTLNAKLKGTAYRFADWSTLYKVENEPDATAATATDAPYKAIVITSQVARDNVEAIKTLKDTALTVPALKKMREDIDKDFDEYNKTLAPTDEKVTWENYKLSRDLTLASEDAAPVITTTTTGGASTTTGGATATGGATTTRGATTTGASTTTGGVITTSGGAMGNDGEWVVSFRNVRILGDKDQEVFQRVVNQQQATTAEMNHVYNKIFPFLGKNKIPWDRYISTVDCAPGPALFDQQTGVQGVVTYKVLPNVEDRHLVASLQRAVAENDYAQIVSILGNPALKRIGDKLKQANLTVYNYDEDKDAQTEPISLGGMLMHGGVGTTSSTTQALAGFRTSRNGQAMTRQQAEFFGLDFQDLKEKEGTAALASEFYCRVVSDGSNVTGLEYKMVVLKDSLLGLGATYQVVATIPFGYIRQIGQWANLDFWAAESTFKNPVVRAWVRGIFKEQGLLEKADPTIFVVLPTPQRELLREIGKLVIKAPKEVSAGALFETLKESEPYKNLGELAALSFFQTWAILLLTIEVLDTKVAGWNDTPSAANDVTEFDVVRAYAYVVINLKAIAADSTREKFSAVNGGYVLHKDLTDLKKIKEHKGMPSEDKIPPVLRKIIFPPPPQPVKPLASHPYDNKSKGGKAQGNAEKAAASGTKGGKQQQKKGDSKSFGTATIPTTGTSQADKDHVEKIISNIANGKSEKWKPEKGDCAFCAANPELSCAKSARHTADTCIEFFAKGKPTVLTEDYRKEFMPRLMRALGINKK